MATEPNTVHVRFRCNSFDSLKLIEYCTNCANAGILYVAEAGFRSRHSLDGSDLWFFMDIDPDSFDDGHTRTELFGIFITQDLNEQGLLSDAEARRLNALWN